MNLETAFARVFSTVFHPLFIPTIGTVILFNLNTYISYSTPAPAKRFILMVMFLNTAVAPLLAIYLFKRAGLIKSLEMKDRHERLLPLLASALFFMFTYFLFTRVNLPSILYYYIMGATLLVLLCLIITFRWKISLHMTSLGGFTGLLIATSFLLKTDTTWLIMLSVLISGLVGSSRILLKLHTQAQVYAGFLLGFFVMLALYTYLRG